MVKLEEIGRGITGQVYRMRHQPTGRVVAAKVRGGGRRRGGVSVDVEGGEMAYVNVYKCVSVLHPIPCFLSHNSKWSGVE